MDKAVIAGGVRRTRQQEEHRLKIIPKPANFQFREQYEEEKAKKNFEVRSRTSKLLALIKTKNTLLNVKADITDFKTKVDNQLRQSMKSSKQAGMNTAQSTGDLLSEFKPSQISQDLIGVE